MFPGRPAGDQQAVGDQYARGVLVGGEDAHRFPGLYQQRLVVLQPSQRRDDGVEGRPVAGGLARAAVDDQVFWALGDLRVKVVAKHAQSGLLLPAAGAELGAARGADRGGDAQRGAPTLPSPASGGGKIVTLSRERRGKIVALSRARGRSNGSEAAAAHELDGGLDLGFEHPVVVKRRDLLPDRGVRLAREA